MDVQKDQVSDLKRIRTRVLGDRNLYEWSAFRTFPPPGMHILFIPKWYPGPRDPQLGDFLRKQAIAVGHKARVSVLYVTQAEGNGTGTIEDVQEDQGIWELSCHYPVRNVSDGIRPFVNFPAYWRAIARGYQRVVAERGKPDIAHAHILARPAAFALFLKQRYGIPYLVSEQSSGYFDGTFLARSASYRRWCRFLLNRASAVTAVSSFLGDRMKELGLVRHFDVIPNVIPGLERPLPPRGDRRDLLVVADLVDRTKNVSGVLRALADARRSDPALKLRIIGDGPDRGMLGSLARQLGLNGSVQFLGRLPNNEVLDVMATAGNVIVNSNVETFSVVTGEALSLGKPVIATRCGGPEAFITPANGILIQPRDDQSLARAILELASRELAAPEAIRRTVHERFSYDAVGSAFMKIYQRVIP